MHDALLVPAQDDQLFAHSRGVEIAGIGNQALMTDEQPGPREHLVQLFLVEIGIAEDLAADEAVLRINEFGDVIEAALDCHRHSSVVRRFPVY